jgi:hypothetical protein
LAVERSEACAAPTALDLFLLYPALTGGANVCRAYGAGLCEVDQRVLWAIASTEERIRGRGPLGYGARGCVEDRCAALGFALFLFLR